MTIEEARKFFGESFIMPDLKYFNEHKRKLGHSKNITPKKSKKYWYYFTKYEKDFVEQFGKSSGWVLGTVVFRRNDVSFLKFEGSKDPNFEVSFIDDADGTMRLVPETISAKEYKINSNLSFAFNDLGGRVKFID